MQIYKFTIFDYEDGKEVGYWGIVAANSEVDAIALALLEYTGGVTDSDIGAHVEPISFNEVCEIPMDTYEMLDPIEEGWLN